MATGDINDPQYEPFMRVLMMAVVYRLKCRLLVWGINPCGSPAKKRLDGSNLHFNYVWVWRFLHCQTIFDTTATFPVESKLRVYGIMSVTLVVRGPTFVNLACGYLLFEIQHLKMMFTNRQ